MESTLVDEHRQPCHAFNGFENAITVCVDGERRLNAIIRRAERI
jgi:hypothetical protein